MHQKPEPTAVISLILICSMVFLGFAVVGPILGFFISLPFFPGNMMEYADALQNIPQHPEIKIPLYIIQGCATLIGLIIGPVLFIQYQKKRIKAYFENRPLEIIPMILTVITVIVFMGANSFFVEWNSTVQFPEFLKGFEEWAKEKESAATAITEFLTHFDSFQQVIIALIVIAILPAIGEELVFRGLIQNEFYRGTKNIHLSIWISAVLFSAIHMQFYGFVPRMLLGAVFGYLYYWSANIWIAMLAHFINNATAVIGMYLNQIGYFDFDVESSDAAPMPIITFSAALTILLLYSFKKYYQQKTNPT